MYCTSFLMLTLCSRNGVFLNTEGYFMRHILVISTGTFVLQCEIISPHVYVFPVPDFQFFLSVIDCYCFFLNSRSQT